MKPPSDCIRTSPDGGKKSASGQAKDDTEEWSPEPCELRDGEESDLSGHARRNIEQLREGVRQGHLEEETAREAEARIRERDTRADEGRGADE